MTDKLNAGTTFVDMTLTLLNGDSVNIPEDIRTPYQVVLFYRGHW